MLIDDTFYLFITDEEVEEVGTGDLVYGLPI